MVQLLGARIDPNRQHQLQRRLCDHLDWRSKVPLVHDDGSKTSASFISDRITEAAELSSLTVLRKPDGPVEVVR